MRHSLWILNSSLVVIFIVSILINLILRQSYSPMSDKSFVKQQYATKEISNVVNVKIEKIYKNDLFDTYVPKTEQEAAAAKIPPLPAQKPPKISSLPQPKKIEMLPPLSIVLKGIMYSSDPEKSLALIEDETAKESSYHIGEKIKDAQVVKISQDRIVLLRTNGQQETLLLRKEEGLLDQPKEKWALVIKKTNDTNFEVDPINLKKEIPTLGTLLEALSLAAIYHDEAQIGVQVGTLENNSIGSLLGFKSQDIIEKVNQTNTASTEDRINIFSELKKLKIGDVLTVSIIRNNIPMTLTYKLTHIKPILVPPFGQKTLPDEKAIKLGLFELGKDQKYSEQKRQFYNQHPKKEREETASDIRKQILENMKRRQQSSRIF